jgi:hypothetical protein
MLEGPIFPLLWATNEPAVLVLLDVSAVRVVVAWKLVPAKPGKESNKKKSAKPPLQNIRIQPPLVLGPNTNPGRKSFHRRSELITTW